MLKFISFGSGSSGNCYYLSTETDGLLIDLGIGIRKLKKYFKEYGISIPQVKRVLITHDHADHIKSVGSFSKDFNVPVYATEQVHKGIISNWSVQCKIPDAQRCVIVPGETYQMGDFEVSPFSVPHDSSDNVGYEIRVGDVSFVLITDAGSVTDEIKTRISHANYLVIEANHDVEMLSNGPYPAYLKNRILSEKGHLSNVDCAEALAQNITEGLRHVWLCHLSEENNHPELARKTVDTILRSYGIIPGKDLDLEVLKRLSPMGLFELV